MYLSIKRKNVLKVLSKAELLEFKKIIFTGSRPPQIHFSKGCNDYLQYFKSRAVKTKKNISFCPLLNAL